MSQDTSAAKVFQYWAYLNSQVDEMYHAIGRLTFLGDQKNQLLDPQCEAVCRDLDSVFNLALEHRTQLQKNIKEEKEQQNKKIFSQNKKTNRFIKTLSSLGFSKANQWYFNKQVASQIEEIKGICRNLGKVAVDVSLKEPVIPGKQFANMLLVQKKLKRDLEEVWEQVSELNRQGGLGFLASAKNLAQGVLSTAMDTQLRPLAEKIIKYNPREQFEVLKKNYSNTGIDKLLTSIHKKNEELEHHDPIIKMVEQFYHDPQKKLARFSLELSKEREQNKRRFGAPIPPPPETSQTYDISPSQENFKAPPPPPGQDAIDDDSTPTPPPTIFKAPPPPESPSPGGQSAYPKPTAVSSGQRPSLRSSLPGQDEEDQAIAMEPPSTSESTDAIPLAPPSSQEVTPIALFSPKSQPEESIAMEPPLQESPPIEAKPFDPFDFSRPARPSDILKAEPLSQEEPPPTQAPKKVSLEQEPPPAPAQPELFAPERSDERQAPQSDPFISQASPPASDNLFYNEEQESTPPQDAPPSNDPFDLSSSSTVLFSQTPPQKEQTSYPSDLTPPPLEPLAQSESSSLFHFEDPIPQEPVTPLSSPPPFPSDPSRPPADPFLSQPSEQPIDPFLSEPTRPPVDPFLSEPTRPPVDPFLSEPSEQPLDPFLSEPTEQSSSFFNPAQDQGKQSFTPHTTPRRGPVFHSSITDGPFSFDTPEKEIEPLPGTPPPSAHNPQANYRPIPSNPSDPPPLKSSRNRLPLNFKSPGSESNLDSSKQPPTPGFSPPPLTLRRLSSKKLSEPPETTLPPPPQLDESWDNES